MMIRRSPGRVFGGDFFSVLRDCMAEHSAEVGRLNRLDDYYRGVHDILSRDGGSDGAPYNRLVCNFAKFITDTACGYMFGEPVAFYTAGGGNSDAVVVSEVGDCSVGVNAGDSGAVSEGGRCSVGANVRDSGAFAEGEVEGGTGDLGSILKSFERAEVNTHDAELGKALSVFGYGYELVFVHEGEPYVAIIDPRSAFVVYDDTVKTEPLFAVLVRDDGLSVYLPDVVNEYTLDGELVSGEANVLGRVPIVQYWNNEEGMGDFESVLSLIDAYNILQSDRLNDKQRFVNAILKVRGAGFETDEFGRLSGDARNLLRSGILQLPEDADASYLTKSLNEAEVELLKNSIAADIHKFSQIPDFSDRHFAGNQSGVALRFKLVSLEYLCRVKERFFASGVRERIRLFSRVLEMAGRSVPDVDGVEISFRRELPFEG